MMASGMILRFYLKLKQCIEHFLAADLCRMYGTMQFRVICMQFVVVRGVVQLLHQRLFVMYTDGILKDRIG